MPSVDLEGLSPALRREYLEDRRRLPDRHLERSGRRTMARHMGLEPSRSYAIL